MMDFLTRLCVLGAAALFAAWLVLENKERIAGAADALLRIPRWRMAARRLNRRG